MKIVELSQDVLGQKLGKNLYNANGNLMLRKGVEINPHYLDHFKKKGYKSIYLLNNDLEVTQTSSHLLSERLLCTSPFVLKRIFRNLMADNKKKASDAKYELIALTESIILNVNDQNQKVPKVLDLKTQEDYLYQHSINVAAYSVLIGEKLKYPRTKLFNLVLASLLHDFGMLFIDNEIVNKASRLEEIEQEKVREHTTKGFRHLIGPCSFDGLSSVASVQHHERFDGSGYPRKIGGDDIHEYSRIITLIDFYDASTSDRPHRRLHSIDQTLDFIESDEGKAFDPKIVDVFLDIFE